jgi:hypothetical protein
VRDTLKVGFPGGTYEHIFYVADVEATGAATNGELHVGLDETDFLGLFPLKAPGHVRLVGTVRDQAPLQGRTLTWDDVNTRVMAWMPVEIARVNWFSTYHVHHRVAGRFREGRAFLLGDAAHIHSPVGGQGMNTGIGDAVNLAWKLAWVLQGRADAAILDSYEPERIAFARRLVSTTDRAFTAVSSSGRFARFMRLRVAPALLPAIFGSKALAPVLFRTVSQTGIDYRSSSLSEGRAGSVHGGDRLPWVKLGDADNFAPLTALDWQVHVYGDAADDLRKLCADRALALEVFPWQADMARAGLQQHAAYLLRPDGYVAVAAPQAETGRIAAYLDAHRIAARAVPLGAPSAHAG